MMLRTIVCLALALALAAAVEEDGLANAHDTIKLMKSQGLGADACQALAESSIQDVNSAKGTTQSFLNTLDTGATCAQRGQKEVAAAKQSLNDATNAASHAKSALDNASAVVPVITIPSVATLMGMRETCDFIYGSDAVKNANAALVTAQVTKTQADAQVVSYTTALKAAQDAASAAAKQCRCDAKSKLESEWTIASDPTNAATQKSSWDQAQNILCALNAKSPCNAPAVPTLVKPTLSPDTVAQDCTPAAVLKVLKDVDCFPCTAWLGTQPTADACKDACKTHVKTDLDGLDGGRPWAYAVFAADKNCKCSHCESTPAGTTVWNGIGWTSYPM